MGFRSVQNSGQWLPGGTYTYCVLAVWCPMSVYLCNYTFEYQMIQHGILSCSSYYGTGAHYALAVGQGFLYTEANTHILTDLYAQMLDTPNQETTLFAYDYKTQKWGFDGMTVSGPTIQSVEVLNAENSMKDPWTGQTIIWTQEYLFGVVLTVTVTIPENLPHGIYYILSLFEKYSYGKYFGANIIRYKIMIGEDYWPGGLYNPLPASDIPAVTTTQYAEGAPAGIEVLPITVSGPAPGVIPERIVVNQTYEYGGRKLRLVASTPKLDMRPKCFGIGV